MPPPQPPWRTLLLKNLTETKTTSFSLTTIARDKTNNPVPRSRTVEFRGFWPNPVLHANAVSALNEQGIGVNPPAYESDMLSLTTDVRMEKVGQLAASDGVVEALFWVAGVSVQWRVRGRGYVTGSGSGGGEEEEEKARRRIREGMRVTGEGNVEGWDWERCITAYFANHSPVMRGSFRNPPPGQLLSEESSDPELGLGHKVEDLLDPVARRNFRVVVVYPEEVERLDLTDYERVRRTKWELVDGEKWEEAELWP